MISDVVHDLLETAAYHSLPRTKPHVLVVDERTKDLDKVVSTFGGKWERKVKGYEFADDPRTRLDEILECGAIERDDLFDPPQTSVALADHLVRRADLRPGMSVMIIGDTAPILEALNRAQVGSDALLRQLGAWAVEPIVERANTVRSFRVPVVCEDFLRIGMVLHPDGNLLFQPPNRFQRVIGNLSRVGFEQPHFDIDCAERAREWLAPGGRAVLGMANSICNRTNPRAGAFRQSIHVSGGDVLDLFDNRAVAVLNS